MAEDLLYQATCGLSEEAVMGVLELALEVAEGHLRHGVGAVKVTRTTVSHRGEEGWTSHTLIEVTTDD